MKRPLVPSVAAEVERWSPAGWSDTDLLTIEPLLPTVRAWVANAAPSNANRARWLLRATAAMVVWAHHSLGTADLRTVLHPININHWAMIVNAEKSAVWRETTRGALRTVGRAANPDWPPPSPTVGRRAVAVPYTASEETTFYRAARLPGRANRAARMWVVCGSLGAGLHGPEVTAANTSDLIEIADGRLAIQVRGRKPRLAPIRRYYTDLAWAAISDTPGRRFITGTNHNAVHWVTDLLGPIGRKGLSLRRARSTWLLAHIVAGTPLDAIKQIAGSLSASTLNELLEYRENTLDDQTSAIEGLRA